MIPLAPLHSFRMSHCSSSLDQRKNYQATASNNGLLCMYALCSLLLFCGKKNLESPEIIQEVKSKLIDKLKFWTERMLASMKLSLKVNSFVSLYSYFEPFRIIRNISTTYLNQYNLFILIELFRISDKQANLKNCMRLSKNISHVQGILFSTRRRFFIMY